MKIKNADKLNIFPHISPFKRCLILVVSVLSYTIIFLVVYNYLKTGEFFFNRGLAVISELIFYNFFTHLPIVILNYYVIFRWSLRFNLDKNIFIKILIDLVCWVLIVVGVDKLIHTYLETIKNGLTFDWVGSLLNTLFIFLILETSYFIVSSRKAMQKAEEEHRKVLQYQYDALNAQINPHFLFNSLNILYSLVSIDVQKSKEFILALASMYRYIMDQQRKKQISVKEEFEFLDSYISVLKMRYHNQFDVEIFGRNLISDEQIIPYTLQLLIENVTKHNVISTKNPMKVQVNVTDEFVTVSNPIQKKESEVGNGIGLSYISEQYNLRRKKFEIENDGVYFTAKIPYL